ncbi:NUDIX hydrolase [Enterovirga aerilata]|uniref:NUDIX hydrolase n=1 Tax=Enterovirga aerilata TaxID=2730920 RepID=UPI001FF02BDB|nr:NUDIX hydrolase [Enterovirga sp. DB1703]
MTAEGIEVSPYYVLEYPDFVHVVAYDADDRIVLVRQYRHGLGGTSLELPGGVAEPSDADALATARRELREETGYQGGSFALQATLSPDPAKLTNRLHLVVAHGVCPGRFSPDRSEQISVELVSRAQAYELALSGAIMHAQHVGLLLTALQRRF